MIIKIAGSYPQWIIMDRVLGLEVCPVDGPRVFELRAIFPGRYRILARSPNKDPLVIIAENLMRGFIAGEKYACIPEPEESG